MELKDVKNKVIQLLDYEDERGFTHEHSKYIAVDPDGDAYVYGDKPIWVYEQEWWEGQGEIFTYLGNIEDSVEDAYRALWSIKELEDDTVDNTDCLQIPLNEGLSELLASDIKGTFRTVGNLVIINDDDEEFVIVDLSDGRLKEGMRIITKDRDLVTESI